MPRAASGRSRGKCRATPLGEHAHAIGEHGFAGRAVEGVLRIRGDGPIARSSNGAYRGRFASHHLAHECEVRFEQPREVFHERAEERLANLGTDAARDLADKSLMPAAFGDVAARGDDAPDGRPRRPRWPDSENVRCSPPFLRKTTSKSRTKTIARQALGPRASLRRIDPQAQVECRAAKYLCAGIAALALEGVVHVQQHAIGQAHDGDPVRRRIERPGEERFRFGQRIARLRQVLVIQYRCGKVGDGAGEELLVGGPVAPFGDGLRAHHADRLARAPDAGVQERDHIVLREVRIEFFRSRVRSRIRRYDGPVAQQRLEVHGVARGLEFHVGTRMVRPVVLVRKMQDRAIFVEEPDGRAADAQRGRERLGEGRPCRSGLGRRDATLQQAE